jgi:hypothetical protein
MPKVYKVVKHIEGEGLFSVKTYGKAQVKYEPGKWAQPPEFLQDKKYDLFVFRTLQDAKDYFKYVRTYRNIHSLHEEDLQLWEAETEVIFPPPPNHLNGFLLQDGIIRTRSSRGWPRGTCTCKKLKLTKRVRV